MFSREALPCMYVYILQKHVSAIHFWVIRIRRRDDGVMSCLYYSRPLVLSPDPTAYILCTFSSRSLHLIRKSLGMHETNLQHGLYFY